MRQALTAFVWPIYQVNNRTVGRSVIYHTRLRNNNCTCNAVTRCIDLLPNQLNVKLITQKAVLNLNWWRQFMNHKHCEGWRGIEGRGRGQQVFLLSWCVCIFLIGSDYWIFHEGLLGERDLRANIINHERAEPSDTNSTAGSLFFPPLLLMFEPHQSGMTRLINLIRRACTTAGPVSNADWTRAKAKAYHDQLFCFIKTTPLSLPYGQ